MRPRPCGAQPPALSSHPQAFISASECGRSRPAATSAACQEATLSNPPSPAFADLRICPITCPVGGRPRACAGAGRRLIGGERASRNEGQAGFESGANPAQAWARLQAERRVTHAQRLGMRRLVAMWAEPCRRARRLQICSPSAAQRGGALSIHEHLRPRRGGGSAAPGGEACAPSP